MKTRFIAAVMALISLWGASAPLVLAASVSTPKPTTLKTHACCPSGHSSFALPVFVSPPPASLPCGGQSPCCAKQAPLKPALLAFNHEDQPGMESAPVRTTESASGNRIGASVTSADDVSASLLLPSAVLRI